MDRYAVVGNPIAHSKSPSIHSAFAAQTGQSLDYQKILVPVDGFALWAEEFFAGGGKGCNVTVPFKEDAYRFASRLTPRAQLAGAVNTLARQANGDILGDTTDGAGLVADILAQGWMIQGRRVLVIGAGGAVRGVLQPLLALQPLQLTIVNRTLGKAQELADIFAPYGPIDAVGFEQLANAYDLIINGTSASLQGELPPINASVLAPDTCVYDMMYGAALTPFLAWAKAAGAAGLADGLGMLVGQAAEAFYLWRGLRPQTAPVLAQLRGL